jgi:hypothetical protein
MSELTEEEYIRNEENTQKAMALADSLTTFVNGGNKAKLFIDAFKCQHRTLQQSAFKMMLELLEEMTTEDYRVDGRNEASQEIARDLIEGFKLVREKRYIAEGTAPFRALEYVSNDGGKPSKYLPLI